MLWECLAWVITNRISCPVCSHKKNFSKELSNSMTLRIFVLLFFFFFFLLNWLEKFAPVLGLYVARGGPDHQPQPQWSDHSRVESCCCLVRDWWPLLRWTTCLKQTRWCRFRLMFNVAHMQILHRWIFSAQMDLFRMIFQTTFLDFILRNKGPRDSSQR